MPLDNALEIIKNVPEILDCIDLLLYHRPVPHREYDQIYMKARYMLQQVGDIWPSLSNKNVVFLGDGDGMSLLFALLSSKYPMDIKSMSIMDFDERILHSLKEIEESQNLNCSLSYYLYNIINPVDSNLRQKFDYFYINPPYGSKNNGLSCIMWLHRCMDLCSVNAEGCIIVPFDDMFPWSVKSASAIIDFLNQSGFEITSIKKNVHQYHLGDNPTLKSSVIQVKRIRFCQSAYHAHRFPLNMCLNLYGSPRAIPQYIYFDNKNPFGNSDFNWEYGNISNFFPDAPL